MAAPVRWGVLGAARIADRAILPAIRRSESSEVVAIASTDRARATTMAAAHAIPTVHDDYATLLADPAVDAVYVPLPNSFHLPWTQRALAAGKHVLCEKPLAMNATEAEEMAQSARKAGRLLMEAVMYRFHPRMRALAASVDRTSIRHLSAAFSFPLRAEVDYRLQPELGGGALLDVGFYTVDVARWLLGEPERVEALLRHDQVDMSCSALLGFPGGAQAAVFSSFEAPEHQELVVVCSDRVERVDQPFTGYRNPDDPYQLMVEAFAEAVRSGGPSPLPIESSIGTMRVLDRVRDAAG